MAPEGSGNWQHSNGLTHAETFPAVPNNGNLYPHGSIRSNASSNNEHSQRTGRPHSVSLSAHFRSITQKPSRDRSIGEKSIGEKSVVSNHGDIFEENRAAHRIVRTLPPWIDSVDEDDLEYLDPVIRQRPRTPADALIAQHNHSPYDGSTSQTNTYGDTPITAAGPLESRWRTFIYTSGHARLNHPDEKRVPPEWLNENWTDYSAPWLGNRTDEDLEDNMYESFRRKQEHWLKRFRRTILRSPMVPLVVRLTVFICSAVALALGGRIHHLSNTVEVTQGPSAEMAIVVDAIALVYTCYITWDEYTGKPLGLRSAGAKLRLIFLDILFIVFAAANLSLAFEALTDVQGSCRTAIINNQVSERYENICDAQKALASILFIVLVSWLMTFAISTLRLVDRAVQK